MRLCKKVCFKGQARQFLIVLGGIVFFCSAYSLYAAFGYTQLPKERRNNSVSTDSTEAATPTVDKYTQSEAHMSLPAIKERINKTYNLTPYRQLINTILANEKKYKDYYVFYHGTDNVWRLAQDVYSRLYAHFHPQSRSALNTFTFLRFEDKYGPKAQEFLMTELKKSGLINDHGEMGAILLSVNLALFGNIGVPSECTWEYFVKSRGHLNPQREIYEKMMNKFGLTQRYIDELLSLVDLYKTKEETIIQIFIPRDKVDEIGYVSWIKGVPADTGVMDWVKTRVENKTFEKTRPAIITLTEQFKKEQERNPLFKNLIERIKSGDFSLNAFLHMYRNTPEAIKNINDVMARLIFTKDVLANPHSGIKIFRFSMATTEQLQKYHQKLDAVIRKIVTEKPFS